MRGWGRCWNYLQSYEDTDDAQVDGYLDPISSRISGTVIAVYVNNNQRVQAGQLLIQLDPRDYQVAIEQAQAQLAQAQADLNAARQQYVSAVATIHQAQAQNYLAQRNAQRFAELLRLQVVAQSDFDQYYATARADAATVKVDEAAAASVQRTIGSREAQVQQDQAALDQAELNLSYTRITAPASGIIGNRSAQLGQRVQPGQSLMALTQMNNASDLWVTANFKETQLARMRHGQPVTIHVGCARARFQRTCAEHAGRGADRCTSCCRRKTRPATTSRSCSGCRCESPLTRARTVRHLRPGMSVEPTVWLMRHTPARGRPSTAGDSGRVRQRLPPGQASHRSPTPIPGEIGGRSIIPTSIALTVTLATFMEVLDTSIANVALPHIAGNLSRPRSTKARGS